MAETACALLRGAPALRLLRRSALHASLFASRARYTLRRCEREIVMLYVVAAHLPSLLKFYFSFFAACRLLLPFMLVPWSSSEEYEALLPRGQ